MLESSSVKTTSGQ
jgi:hypothetical protein